jgi:hypothetical protein
VSSVSISASTSLRLIEGADHVLAERVVDRGLAAHRGVDLRQQRGRHLDEGHAALVAGRGEAAHVAHHAAAERDQGGRALAALGEQHVEDAVERLPVLVRLAVGQHHRCGAHARPFQPGAQALEVERPHHRVGDDRDALRLEVGQDQVGTAEQAAADVNGIGALAERHVQGLHVSAL